MPKKKGRWIKERRPISKYKKTDAQKKIAEAGKEIAMECKGKKGNEFVVCRSSILEKFFGK